MGNSQSSDINDDDYGGLLQREHNQHSCPVPGYIPLAQPQHQQAHQELRPPAHPAAPPFPFPASHPVAAPSHSRLLPLSLAPQQTHVPAQADRLHPDSNVLPSTKSSMAFDLTADSPSTSPQRDPPRRQHSGGCTQEAALGRRVPSLMVDMTKDPEVKKAGEGAAQQKPGGSTFMIDLTADEGGEDVRGSKQENQNTQRATQKRPLPQSLVQHGTGLYIPSQSNKCQALLI
eukprot:scaffold126229_cov21-Tisochrysis_lutea.AAC.1